MSRLIFILGEPGSGKSSSLRNLKKDEASVITVTGKEIPVKSDIPQALATTPTMVIELINKSTKPIVVVDDANYLMSFEVFDRSQEQGWQKFTDIADGAYKMFKAAIDKKADQNFYFMAHLEDNDKGLVQYKTLGQTIRNNLVPEGLTNFVVQAVVDMGEFLFKVKADGTGVKTPLGMFTEPTIPNDLKLLDTKIREFYK